jgi:hypothetical protein
MTLDTSTTLRTLRTQLNALIEARIDLAKVLEIEERELGPLTEQRAAKVEKFCEEFRARFQRLPSGAEVTDQLYETSEQERIEAIDAERKKAETRIRQLRSDMQPSLDYLRGPKTAEPFEALDGLLPDLGLNTIDRLTSLIENILQACSGPLRRPKTQEHNDELQQVKIWIRQMRSEKLTHREICERLGDRPRPPRATWRFLPSWLAAYDDPKYREDVRTWISKTVRG